VVTADPVFWSALINTVILTAGSVILALVFGLLFAELVNHRYPGRGIVRTMFITPFLIMPVVSALTWKNMMLNPVFGVVDYLMQLVRLPAVDWLAQFPLAAITGIVVWRWAPFMMLILLAGMQGLSDEIREAARVDGVNAVQEFRYIVLPHLNRFIQLGALLGSVYIVQEFDSIYMTTQGGPGTASTNLPFLIYQAAFAKKDVGEASAIGVMVVILTIIAVQYLLRVLSRLTEGD
jgi:sorbitol/mannitol transport system permease protein